LSYYIKIRFRGEEISIELQKQKISNGMKKNNFEQLIREAILALPEHGRKAMDNVAFVVEREARRKKAKEIGIQVNEVLLGLYEGIPKTKRGASYFGVLPDKITIFQHPIEELAGCDEKKLKKLIYEVVWHEVGHHLGFDEKEIRALETKKRKINTTRYE
jgi:predicted Zn-dependent protease with MMP-like domain